jgi:protein-S-isoprenylcysteine O-methyltransferase Ste14
MPIGKVILGIIFNLAIFGGLLFGPAGTWAWGRAWVFLGVVLVTSIASILPLLASPDLLQERFKAPIQHGQPFADKIILLVFIVEFCGVIVSIPLDVFRWHLLGGPGPLVSSLGLALFIGGWAIVTLALRENAFAAPVVKHQADRHQTVIDTGPYRVVRHPMYAGFIPLMIGMPLWLGSYAATVLAVLPIGTLMVRILVEEEFLRRELPGYTAYTGRVRNRLIPFLW